jgi:hypothetical protein
MQSAVGPSARAPPATHPASYRPSNGRCSRRCPCLSRCPRKTVRQTRLLLSSCQRVEFHQIQADTADRETSDLHQIHLAAIVWSLHSDGG